LSLDQALARRQGRRRLTDDNEAQPLAIATTNTKVSAE